MQCPCTSVQLFYMYGTMCLGCDSSAHGTCMGLVMSLDADVPRSIASSKNVAGIYLQGAAPGFDSDRTGKHAAELLLIVCHVAPDFINGNLPLNCSHVS
jgi:hypothetical protein